MKTKRSAFTIIEIVLVVSIIALIGSLVLTNFGTLLNAFSTQDPEKPFFEALNEARIQALSRGETTYLQVIDQECRVLDLTHEVLFSVPLPKGEARFNAYLPQKGLSSTKAELDRVELPLLPFGKDGSSPAVEVSLKLADERLTLRLDSFSSNKIESP